MQPEEVAALTAALREAFTLASDWIDEQELSILTNPAAWRKRARLSQLRREVASRMASLDADARRFFSRDFPLAYQFGASDAASSLGITFGWSGIDVDAVTLLARDGFQSLLSATKLTAETTKALVRRLARSQALLSLTTGSTATQAGRDLAKLLRQNGIHSVVYANGARHRIGDYADMVLRTTTAQAYAGGQIAQSRRMGVQFMECFDGFDCGLSSHTDPEKVNGNVYPIETAAAFSLAHPRCQRSWSPRPDVETAEQARRAEPSTTPEQRADQAASDQARADAARRRAQQRRAQARAGR